MSNQCHHFNLCHKMWRRSELSYFVHQYRQFGKCKLYLRCLNILQLQLHNYNLMRKLMCNGNFAVVTLMTTTNKFRYLLYGGQISASGDSGERKKNNRPYMCVTRHDFHTKQSDDLPIYLLWAMCVFVWVSSDIQTSNESNPKLIWLHANPFFSGLYCKKDNSIGENWNNKKYFFAFSVYMLTGDALLIIRRSSIFMY